MTCRVRVRVRVRVRARGRASYGPEHRSGPLGLCFPCRFRLASDEGGVDEGRAGRSLLDPYRFLSRSAAKKHDGRTLQRAERTVASFGEASVLRFARKCTLDTMV